MRPVDQWMKRYQLVPIAILLFFGWLTLDITAWYKAHYAELHEWQVVPILGYLASLHCRGDRPDSAASLVAAIRFALEHILTTMSRPHPDA